MFTIPIILCMNKTQKCYTIDNNLVEAAALLKAEQPQLNSRVIEKALAMYLENKVDEIRNDNIRAGIVDHLESYKEAVG